MKSNLAPDVVVLTSYFCRAGDPQRNRRVAADSDALISPWLEGMQRTGLRGVIFHDGLSADFRSRHETGAIRFVEARVPRAASCNDERFFIYRKWLAASGELASVFLTDLFDVRLCRDPTGLVDDGMLWVGCEPWSVRERPSMRSRLVRAYGSIPTWLLNQPILNAGIIGARYPLMLEFLEAFCRELRQLRGRDSTANYNMAALNMLLRGATWQSRVRAPGRPLHSVFRQYEPDSDAFCFAHR